MTAARIHLHVASAGNEVMSHIAEMFAEGFGELGVTCAIVVDGHPLDDADAGATSLVIAPHEFFPLHFLKTKPTIELAPTLARVVVVNVEQPRSEWFERAWEFARRARLVCDISPSGVAEFERRGVPALHAPLGWTAGLVAGKTTPLTARPIDVLFLGHASERRAAFFARHAGFFSSRNCHLLLSEVHRPRTAATPGFASGPARLDAFASSRILLCVHASDRPYFEQHRALLGLANGCLLVSEASRHTAPLEEGVHFVSAPLDELPALCRRYLDEPAALEAVAAAGQRLAADRMRIAGSCRTILAALDASTPGGAADDAARGAVVSRLAESTARAARGDLPWTRTSNGAYDERPRPAVSVVVALFNYARFIRGALDSVVAADEPEGGVEVVVVDDHSSDGSAETVADWMAGANVPALLVRKALNTGLADTRNLGFRLARGRHVFVLDADNWIYPPCLVALQKALNGGGDAAAYGLIACIDEESSQGVDLLSAHAWNPRRLIEGPYLDAMAMFDRQAVLDLGAYSTELVEYGWFGWEDYDLWLKLAQAGRTCRQVPRLLAGYREHSQSMLRRTNRSSERLAAYLSQKFADLVARHPGLETHFSFPASDPDFRSAEQREIAGLRAHVVGLEQRIDALHRSLSWRVTAPLRAVAARLGLARSTPNKPVG